MNEVMMIQIFQILLPVILYFSGCAIAKSGYIAHRKQIKLQIDRRASKVDLMFDGVERRIK
jgi:hypothetical protein